MVSSVSTSSPLTIIAHTADGYRVICSDEACRQSANPIANKIYGTLVKVQEFFLENFGRWGIDGKGSTIPIVVHWDQKSAQWVCEAEFCVFRFHDLYALTPEVVAHEYMHALINELNPLQYYGQTGALNESLADVMGIAFKHWQGEADWRISNIRDISRYSSMGNYYHTLEDNGGVHTNSAIPNHAFYRAADKIGSVQCAASIWFQAFQEVSITASFEEFAKKTVEVSQRADLPSYVTVAILNAWRDVEVLNVTVRERYQDVWDFAGMTHKILKQRVYSYS